MKSKTSIKAGDIQINRRGNPRVLWLGINLAVLSTLFSFVLVVRIYAKPQSVFNSPFISAPQHNNISVGDDIQSVNGELTYNVPINVPPGRNGAQPNLSLNYSSASSIYGGIAQGWSLSVPFISVDTSEGIMALDESQYKSSMGGRLYKSPDEVRAADVQMVYRAENDTTFARYERLNSSADAAWRVRLPNGSVLLFGEKKLNAQTDVLAPLYKQIDSWGNEVIYSWFWEQQHFHALTGYSYYLKEIRYGNNENVGLSHHALINLKYNIPDLFCENSNLPVGSRSDYRSGALILHGYHQLANITTYVINRTSTHTPGFDKVRKYELIYDGAKSNCVAKQYGPRRVLSRVKRIGYRVNGIQDTLPDLEFEYGSLNPFSTRGELVVHDLGWTESPELYFSGHYYTTLASPRNGESNYTGHGPALDFFVRSHRVMRKMLDIDGDGLLDQLEIDSTRGQCQIKWKKGQKNGTFVSQTDIDLPMLPWEGHASTPDSGEYCALNHQRSKYANKPETCIIEANPGGGAPIQYDRFDWEHSFNFLNYRFMDLNYDGRPELIASLDHSLRRLDPEQDAPSYPYFNFDYNYDEYSDIPFTEQLSQLFGSAFDSLQWIYGGSVPLPVPGDLSPWPFREDCLVSQPHVRNGGYPWIVFKNLGNGQFASVPVVKRMPVPLFSQYANTRVAKGQPQSETSWNLGYGNDDVAVDPFALIDVNGDGYLDVVSSFKTEEELNNGATPVPYWKVLLGDNNGNFHANPITNQPYLFNTLGLSHVNGEAYSFAVSYDINSKSRVFTPTIFEDVNGDGLPDFMALHWDGPQGDLFPLRTEVFLNQGSGLNTSQAVTYSPTYQFDQTQSRGDGIMLAQNEDLRYRLDINFVNISSGGQYPRLAARHLYAGNQRFLIDYDGDGRKDWLEIKDMPSQAIKNYPAQPYSTSEKFIAIVRINAGDVFLPPIRVLQSGDKQHLVKGALAQLRKGTQAGDHVPIPYTSSMYREQAVAMLTDMNGDGYPDAAYLDLEGRWKYITEDFQGSPPGLLKAIRNGRGAVTTIQYTYFNADDGTEIFPNGTVINNDMAARKWLVKSIEVDPGADQPKMGTYYQYDEPIQTRDYQGRLAFRGFKKITVARHNESKVTTLYNYNNYYAGLPEYTIVRAVNGDAKNVRQTLYSRAVLPGDEATDVFLVIEDDEHICDNTQTDWQDCLTSGKRNQYLKTYVALTDSSGRRVLYLPKKINQFFHEDDVQIHHRQYFDYESDLTTDKYIYLTTDSKKYVMNGEQEILANHRHNVPYDPERPSRQLQNIRWVYNWINESEYTRTFYDRDVATGVLLKKWEPEQVKAGVNQWTSYQYDAYKLYATRVINPLRHIMDQVVDLGTGVTLVSKGPNWRCRDDSECAYDDEMASPYQETVTIDGFGRVLLRAISDKDGEDDNNYEQFSVERFTYHDRLASRAGNSQTGSITATGVTRKTMTETNTWKTSHTYVDGLSRTLREVTELEAEDAVTDYEYDYKGHLAYIHVINPAQNNGSQVTYHYRYDSLSRLLEVWAPSVQGSGVKGLGGSLPIVLTSYDGLVVTTREHSTAAPGNYAEKRIMSNAIAQVVRVEERLNNFDYAETRYQYDANGNVKEMRGPMTVESPAHSAIPQDIIRMEHDFLGRRTAVEIGNQRWEYAYDHNDNLISETLPSPAPLPSGKTISDYTMTMEYDALNRITRFVPAQANLSDGQMRWLALGDVTYTYDRKHPSIKTGISSSGSGEMIGRLGYSDSPLATIVTHYSPTGEPRFSSQKLKLAGLGEASSDHLASVHEVHRSGLLKSVTLKDLNRGEVLDETLQLSYDEMGLPESIFTATRKFAKVKRNGARHITKRYYNWNDAGHSPDQAAWTYNPRGLMNSMYIELRAPGTCEKCDGAETYAQSLTWNQVGEVTEMREIFGSNVNSQTRSRRYLYQYDTRHQLLRAEQVSSSTNTPGYLGLYTTDYAGRLTGVNVKLGYLGEMPTDAELANMRVHPRHVGYEYDPVNPQQLKTLYRCEVPGCAKQDGNEIFATYTYDERGNVISRTIEGDTWSYLYDGNNRLRYVTHPDGRNETYYYEGAERILAVTRASDNSITKIRRWAGPVEVHYTGNKRREKYWITIKLGQPVARSFNGGERTEIIYSNMQNSRIMTVDDQGSLQLQEGHYGAWGEVLKKDLATSANADEYTEELHGKHYDDIAGMSYYGYRYYDPVSLMWNRADPKYRFVPDIDWSQPRQANLYVFTGNNPISLIDPDGLEAKKPIRQQVSDLAESGTSTFFETLNKGINLWASAAAEKALNAADGIWNSRFGWRTPRITANKVFNAAKPSVAKKTAILSNINKSVSTLFQPPKGKTGLRQIVVKDLIVAAAEIAALEVELARWEVVANALKKEIEQYNLYTPLRPDLTPVKALNVDTNLRDAWRAYDEAKKEVEYHRNLLEQREKALQEAAINLDIYCAQGAAGCTPVPVFNDEVLPGMNEGVQQGANTSQQKQEPVPENH